MPLPVIPGEDGTGASMWAGAQDSSGDLEFAPRAGFEDRRFNRDFPLTG
jgi:hypothetical protein